ncbi:hypothetical protein TMA_137 [Thermus phage TMA]|uniref:hypothetical protein n=1 Tax=Thermus phage TMA TaxID=699370 RepID=UPI00021AADF8|nr:hypothetical protein TMA_137 [Thermus phage TMA]BAK53825.1 hypothetical protein TMA_137 [Thermus phage TMA]
MKIIFPNHVENKKVLQAKKKFDKMLSFVENFEKRFSKDGVIVFYKGNKFLIPYPSLYTKATNAQKAQKDLVYNLETKRHYKLVESFEEISFEKAFFEFLTSMKFFIHLPQISHLVKEAEKNFSIEAVLNLSNLEFSLIYKNQEIWRLKYTTLRDVYLKKKERFFFLIEEKKKGVDKKEEKLKQKNEITLKARQKIEEFTSKANLKILYDDYNIKSRVPLLCSCGNVFEYYLNVLLQYNITSCPSCRIKKSTLEEFFENEVLKNIPFSYEFRYRDELELDFFIPAKNLAIELNGAYWHSEEKKPFNHLQKKKLLFLDRGIDVLFFYEPIVYQKLDIVQSMIKAKLGIFERRIFARKTRIEEIDYTTANKFFEEHHISGGASFKYAFGLYYDDELVAAASFAKPRYNENFSWELVRFASKKNTIVIGALGKMIKHFSPKNLISYADLMYSSGKVYEKLGFKRIGITKPGYFYTKNRRELYPRELFQKHKLKGYYEENKYEINFFDENLSESEIMKANGYMKVPTAGNFVYVLFNPL